MVKFADLLFMGCGLELKKGLHQDFSCTMDGSNQLQNEWKPANKPGLTLWWIGVLSRDRYCTFSAHTTESMKSNDIRF